MRVKKGDTVIVRTGKNRGQSGEVLKVNKENETVTVEGVNEVFRHVKRSQKNMQGGRISKNMPVPAANVMFVCPMCKKPTRLGVGFDTDGKKVRVCKKCGALIPNTVPKDRQK